MAEVDANFEGVFNPLTSGYQGIPPEELIGGSANNASLMISHLNHIFRQLVAQSLHFHYRTSVNGPAGRLTRRAEGSGDQFGTTEEFITNPVMGMVMNESQARLAAKCFVHTAAGGAVMYLDPIDTRIVYIWGKSRILPKDPGSIASKMSLFADSSLTRQREADLNPGRLSSAPLLASRDSLVLRWWEPIKGRIPNQVEGRKYYGIDIQDADSHGSSI